MRKTNSLSPLGLAVIILLIFAILYVGVTALQENREYQKEAAITPTPSITPRTVRITEDPTKPTSTPTPCILQVNSIGLEVKTLQKRLKELGFYAGEVDGQFGQGTKAAVTAFQTQHGVDADGIAGEETLAILYSDKAQTFVPTPTPSPTPSLLSTGSSGEEVKTLQRRLKELGFYTGEIDGDFGKGTASAVKLFQQQHNLSADGMAGQKTLALLYSDNAKQIVITPTPQTIQVMAGALPLLVNRDNPVEKDFVPADLVDMSTYCDTAVVKIKYSGTQGVREAVDALMELLYDAKAQGVTKWQVSAAYRSYSAQESIFESNVREYMNSRGLSRTQAESATLLTVALPGTSEHHTGLAFDITVPGTSMFVGTTQQKWLHEHCWDYGFIIRYTDEKQDITGFMGEEWHIRYVGTEHSLNMKNSGLCLEEYLQYVKQ